MSDDSVPGSSTEEIGPRLKNLRPWKPGQSGNPKGINQYSYKRDFETTIDRLLAGEISEAEATLVPEWVQELVKPGMPRGEALAHIAVVGALRGKEKHLLEALKRIWPVVTKAEASGAEGQPLVPRLEPPDFSRVSEQDQATLRRIARECLMRRPDEDVL
jgi:hypothetical protein